MDSFRRVKENLKFTLRAGINFFFGSKIDQFTKILPFSEVVFL